jgi:hypothetical protein
MAKNAAVLRRRGRSSAGISGAIAISLTSGNFIRILSALDRGAPFFEELRKGQNTLPDIADAKVRTPDADMSAGARIGCKTQRERRSYHAVGYAERDAAHLMLAKKQSGCLRLTTVDANKAFDSKDFVCTARELNVTPHVTVWPVKTRRQGLCPRNPEPQEPHSEADLEAQACARVHRLLGHLQLLQRARCGRLPALSHQSQKALLRGEKPYQRHREFLEPGRPIRHSVVRMIAGFGD